MPIAELLHGHATDLGGGLMVRRMLPDVAQRSVGPFVFFDHFGPMIQQAGHNYDVRPHPHIGLATVTYLFEGAMLHRDSLGHVQHIEPGAINWMSAGRGIVHSERTPDDLRELDRPLHGLQLWVALPQALEDSTPSFCHTAAAELPARVEAGVELRVLVGSALGLTSPVQTASPTVYLDLKMASGTRFEMPPIAAELAIYVAAGHLQADGQTLGTHELAVLQPGAAAGLQATENTRLVVIGGAPLDGPRFMWWNFVSSRKERIREAAASWAADAMGHVPGEVERIPLPDRPL